MAQSGGGFDLPREALRAEGVRQLGCEHLYHHASIMPDVTREIHHGHGTAAELALDHVIRLKRLLQPVANIRVGHMPFHPYRMGSIAAANAPLSTVFNGAATRASYSPVNS